VDGFNQDERASERDEGGEVLCGLLAAQGDPFKALEFADALLDAGATLIENAGKECWLCARILAVRNGGADAVLARRLAVGLGVVALVAENRPRGDVRADVEQDLKICGCRWLRRQ